MKSIFYYQGFLQVFKIIYSKIINHYYNNLLIGYFEIEKTKQFIANIYFWSIICQDIKAYVKSYDIC